MMAVSDPLNNYEMQLEGTNKSDATVQTYVSHVTSFREWLEENTDVGLFDAESKHVRLHMGEVNADYAGKTTKTRFYSINNFYEVMPTDHNPTEGIDSSDYGSTKPERRKGGPDADEHTYLSREQVEELAEHAAENGHAIRDPLIVRLLFETGMRVGELSRTRTEYIERNQGGRYVKGQMTIQSLKKQEGEEEWRTTYWFTDGTNRLLNLWREQHRPAVPRADESDYLFPSQGRDRIREQKLNQIVKDAAESMGIQEVIGTDAAGRDKYKITAHILRHSAARFMLSELGLDAIDVKKIMGHSNIDITDHYAQGTSDDIRDTFEQKLAGADISL